MDHIVGGFIKGLTFMPPTNERPDGKDGLSVEEAKQRDRLLTRCEASDIDCGASFGSLRLTRVTKPRGGAHRGHRRRRNWTVEWKKQTLDELGNQLNRMIATELFSMMMDYKYDSTAAPHDIATEHDTGTIDKPESTPFLADCSQTKNNATSTKPTGSGASCPAQTHQYVGESCLGNLDESDHSAK